MQHWFFKMLAVLSLLLCMAFVGFWARSYTTHDLVERRGNETGYQYRVSSFRGGLYVEEFASLGNVFWYRFSRPAEDEEELPLLVYDWNFLGLHYDSSSLYTPGGRMWILVLPYWFLAAVTALPVPHLLISLKAWMVRTRQSRNHLTCGLCSTCGYDLRAHKLGDHCPECGTAISLPAAAGAKA